MLAKIFPFLLWFKDYNGGKLKIDVVAGITVAMVLIPQSMAYAQLAGLPPYYGLYAAFLPPMIAALFGSSRQLATGPVAVVSMMSASALEPLATAGGAEFIAYSVILALTVGCFQLFLGVFRLGLIINLLSHPVVNGFTNAAAIVIASSQFSKLFGVYVDKADHHYQTIIDVVKSAFHYTHLPTLGMAVLAIAIMVILKRINPRIPNVLIAVAVTILLSYFTGFNNDKLVSLENIKAPKVVTIINDFNNEIKTIERLGAQRANLNQKIKKVNDKVKAQGLTIVTMEQLDNEHQLAVLNAQIDAAKEAAHVKREALRLIHFLVAENAGDTNAFYIEATLPKGVETDGHKWRLKVGNKMLNPDKLLMMGAGAVVGTIPEGLVFGIPKAPKDTTYLSVFLQLLPFAVIIALVGFMEAIAIAKSMAAKTGQKLDTNQELIGQGLANIIGSFGQSYSISGSFSRSSVNLQANAVSGISSVVTSLMVGVTLLFFTPLLYHLPQAVLASVIMMAVIGLVNVDGFVHAWKAKRSDGVISVIAFICTLYLAPHLHEGILVGVALTFIVFMYKTLRPTVSTVARAEDTAFKIIKENETKCEHIAVIRFDGPLIFANATYLEDKVLEYIAETPTLRRIIIAGSGINDIDASGEAALSILIDTVRESDRHISFCRIKEEVYAVLERTHLLEKIGKENFYIDGSQALNAAYTAVHENNECDKNCPLDEIIF
ncbi:MAG: STAS domain-containing protein [Deltaproteobacteria bacterium]|jgi:sulfate permease, SulP family|nr:STAS domain-containing protein [Deltaproteobacteria bacterium]MBT4263642.1 STAS domain-containing protein [Deltaproteobacteria bacterium]MBT4644026.1 STAS domain-containing protein [Deltaproteobacteria bacterium]MBT6503675.1 STAS domain-containing protein [Deltaproteobacteria bacterium]MBT7152670.1 STAS domain-containing protein [Deltaproteobacteria bacterium]